MTFEWNAKLYKVTSLCLALTGFRCIFFIFFFKDLQYSHMDSAPAGHEPWMSGQTSRRVALRDTRRQNTFCSRSHSDSILARCHQGVPEVRRIEGVESCCVGIDEARLPRQAPQPKNWHLHQSSRSSSWLDGLWRRHLHEFQHPGFPGVL